MLIERRVDFTHGYRMRCEHCSTLNWLTAEDYQASTESMMKCSACGDDFNFGPAVIDLRDPEDAALNDTSVPQLAWYHTTTDPQWPRTAKPLPDDEVKHLRERVGWSDEQIDRRREVHENQALHLGTYEAAIESMLRRMNDQNDQESTFYLYRVRLHPNLIVEPNWRDENQAEAAKITSFDLARQNVDGIRYLNAHESIGSISLAIVRRAIESVQRTVVPVPELLRPHDAATLEQIRSFRKEVHAIRAAHRDRPPNALDKIRMRASKSLGGPPPPEPNEAYGALSAMGRFVADQYLSGVSPVVRENFLRSLHPPRPTDDDAVDRAWLSRFMGLSTTLTRPQEVQRVLASKPWRAVQST